MVITVNGKEMSFDDGLTLAGFVADIVFNKDAVVIERNHAVAPRDKWPDIVLKNGDTMEIISFVGGG